MAKKDEVKICFVLMPFDGNIEDVYRIIIAPSLMEAGYQVRRADSIAAPGNIIRDILQAISSADLIVADLTGRNPNVFYELAVAQTLGKPTILLTQDYRDIPFDLKMYRMIEYNSTLEGAEILRRQLLRTVQTIEMGDRPSSPVQDFLRDLPPLHETQRLRKQLESVNRELSHCQRARKELEDKAGRAEPLKLTAEEVILQAIKHEGFRALQLELAKKEEQIQEFIRAPNPAGDLASNLERENRRLLDELQLLRSKLQVEPHWGLPPTSPDSSYVFVLMPFREEWSDIVWEVIRSAVTASGFVCERADDKAGKFVMKDIWAGINAARIVIADLTEGNPNVTYEVGMCDVLGKDQILLAQDPKAVPFDFLGIRLVPYTYKHGGIAKLKEELRKRLLQIVSHDRGGADGRFA
jgi:nucleoside 2-deoxyribosyltransferase